MISFVSSVLPLLTLLSHIIFVVLVLALVFRKSWGAPIVGILREQGFLLGIALTLFIFLGSIFYSSVIGYPPCELCWWQRVFLFSQLPLFVLAWKADDRGVYKYVLWLSIIAGLVSIYQIYAQSGGVSLLDCTAVGGACSKVYVKAYGYITIPWMGLTASAYLLLLALANRKHE